MFLCAYSVFGSRYSRTDFCRQSQLIVILLFVFVLTFCYFCDYFSSSTPGFVFPIIITTSVFSILSRTPYISLWNVPLMSLQSVREYWTWKKFRANPSILFCICFLIVVVIFLVFVYLPWSYLNIMFQFYFWKETRLTMARNQQEWLKLNVQNLFFRSNLVKEWLTFSTGSVFIKRILHYSICHNSINKHTYSSWRWKSNPFYMVWLHCLSVVLSYIHFKRLTKSVLFHSEDRTKPRG